MSQVSITSFTPTGTPRRGASYAFASKALACFSTRSGSMKDQALRVGSRASIRARHHRAISSLRSLPAFVCAAISVAERSDNPVICALISSLGNISKLINATTALISNPSYIRRLLNGIVPERRKLGRNDLVVVQRPFEQTEVAGELVHARDKFTRNQRVVER